MSRKRKASETSTPAESASVPASGRCAGRSPVARAEEDVLRRGLDAFAELGYDGASVRELARRLGVSHNYVNERYGSKGAFWRAVVDFALAETDDHLDAAVEADGDDLELIRSAVSGFYRVAARNPQLNRLIADEAARESERLDHLYEHFIKPRLDGITPTITRLVAEGRIPPGPTHLLYFAVTGPLVALSQLPLARRLGRAEEGDAEGTENAEMLASLVLDGLLRDPDAAHLAAGPRKSAEPGP